MSDLHQARAVRVYLLDDHEVVRTGLRQILDDAGGFVVVGESGSAREAMRETYDDAQALTAATLAGASGYLMKRIRGFELASIVRRAAAGESLIDAHAAAQAVRTTRVLHSRWGPAVLTRREEDVLDLMVEGLTNRQIGARLGVQEKTVKNYVTAVLQKLGVASRTQAAIVVTRQREERPGQARE